MVSLGKDFKLPVFRELYDNLKINNSLVNFFLKSLLLYLEDRYYNNIIETVVKNKVDQAVDEYHTQMDQVEPIITPPVYTETYTEASTSLPEMRITAPWYNDSK